MSKENLKKTLKTVKDLILFDSVWKKRNKIKSVPQKALERLSIYRNLVKNSFNDLTVKIYPNTNKLLKKEWGKLLSDYIEKYPPDSPILNRLTKHFPEYLSQQKQIKKKYPFIDELALYEWIEVELYDASGERVKKTGLNPVHQIYKFKYHIPDITENLEAGKKLNTVVKPKPVTVLIYRDPKTFNVRFNEITDGTLAYLELLKSGLPHNKILELLSIHYGIEKKDKKIFFKQINEMVKTLKERRIII